MFGVRARLSGKSAITGVVAAGVLAVAATGCGSASGSTGGAGQAAVVVKSGAQALKNANSVGFDVRASLDLQGSLKGVNPSQGALLNGPLTLELKGHAAKTNGTGAFDTTFTIGGGDLTLSGEVKSPDGKTAYIQAPMLLGSGWQSFKLNNGGHWSKAPSMGSGQKLQKQLHAAGFNPLTLLKNIAVTSGSGTDTVSADLNVAGLVRAIAKMSHGQVPAGALRQLNGVIQVAHGSVSYDSSSHLPSAAHLEVAVHVPSKYQHESKGLSGADVKIDATFDDWNEPVNVTAPSSSTPLNLSHVQGLGMAGI